MKGCLAALRRDNPLPPIAARLVRLKRSGAGWTGCCPFHPDRSPSFTIYDEGQRFKCFGCGAGGDVLDFVQRAYGMDLAGAIRALGGEALPKAASALDGEFLDAIKRDRPDRMTEARAIWQRAVPAAGTLAEAYLRGGQSIPPIQPRCAFCRSPMAIRSRCPV